MKNYVSKQIQNVIEHTGRLGNVWTISCQVEFSKNFLSSAIMIINIGIG